MKDITLFINEAVSKKFDYWEDVIEFPGYELKVPKKYIKPINKTNYYQKEFLEKFFGWINQWLDKNIKNMVKDIIKGNHKYCPEEIWIKLPSDLNGKLCLDFDYNWIDDVPHGSLRSAKIEVNHVHVPTISSGEFHEAKADLQYFQLNEPIKF